MCHSVVKEPSSYVTHKRYLTNPYCTNPLRKSQQRIFGLIHSLWKTLCALVFGSVAATFRRALLILFRIKCVHLGAFCQRNEKPNAPT